jgi:hypothetical protein
MYMTEGTSPTYKAFALLLLENGNDPCRDMARGSRGKE